MHSLRRTPAIGTALLLGVGLAYFFVLPYLGPASEPHDFTGVSGDAQRGAYVVRAAGCVGCHTDPARGGETFSGGPALKTAFGTFYGPNITPDETYGIGGWSLEQFSSALADGLSPDGEHYFPAFPYSSYSKMSAQDVADLKAYLDNVTPVANVRRTHELSWPFSDRKLLGLWKLLNFEAGRFQPNPNRDEAWNRGAYLVQGPGHCAECHTQRNLLGGFYGAPLAGNSQGPNGKRVPAIDALFNHPGQPWTKEDLVLSLQTGLLPNGDTFDGLMGEFVDQSSSYLSDEDTAAISVYLFSSQRQE
ncbi:cytochrome c [Pelagibius sp. Alg239-R121]|uniref:c-type cytochrome n=1 Tax=Pelagibius sp. Alg239-R121 TaxID=2993448 RepID=UPI0024A6C9FA|nr:cytochrome c [Pelagibius sp. Alg239-R121]